MIACAKLQQGSVSPSSLLEHSASIAVYRSQAKYIDGVSDGKNLSSILLLKFTVTKIAGDAKV
jgi:hypothetical protein